MQLIHRFVYAGANGLANPRHFQVPVAALTDCDEGFQKYNKFLNHIFVSDMTHSPFDVVAWHGNYCPYKYDLAYFNTINSVSFDHLDPSSTCESAPAIANVKDCMTLLTFSSTHSTMIFSSSLLPRSLHGVDVPDGGAGRCGVRFRNLSAALVCAREHIPRMYCFINHAIYGSSLITHTCTHRRAFVCFVLRRCGSLCSRRTHIAIGASWRCVRFAACTRFPTLLTPDLSRIRNRIVFSLCSLSSPIRAA